MDTLMHEDVEKEFAGDVKGDTDEDTVLACISICAKADTIVDVVQHKYR